MPMDMAVNTDTSVSDRDLGQERIYEWPVQIVSRMLVTNRNIGSPSTINIMLSFPTPDSLDIARLTTRLAEVQRLWPLLCVTIADQRTTRPKMQYRYSVWDTDSILAYETYIVKTNGPKAERDAIYDTALRLFQVKVSFDRDPLWRVTIFRASSNAETNKVYLALTMDHAIIDGRGAIKLAQALVADDISQLRKEDIELYEKAILNAGMEENPPFSFILSVICRMVLLPRLPAFVQRLLGYHPTWPQKIPQPTIDSPWKSSILEVSSDLMRKLKEVGKRRGITTLNPTLHTAWMAALWAVLVRKEINQEIRDCSVKDLRDVTKGDPYCLSSHATTYIWSPGVLSDATGFWATARSYAAVSIDPQAHADGANLIKMLNLLKEGQIEPGASKHRAPSSLELPAGDKTAHTLHDEEALKKINSLSPYTGISGIWSNVSYFALPQGATDMVFGVSGNATGTAFNTCLVGHENGVRFQNAYSDGAAMTEREVKKAERLCLNILETIVNEYEKDMDWSLGELVIDG